MPKTSDLKNSENACEGAICYGQALSETSGWYGDYAGFVYREARGPYAAVTTVIPLMQECSSRATLTAPLAATTGPGSSSLHS